MESIINKTVNIKDVSILSILYPDYTPKSYVNFLDYDTNVIYIGKPLKNLIQYLEANTKSFINTVGNCDIDLSAKEDLFEYVLALHGKTMTSKYKSFIDTVDDKEFNYCLKLLAMTGKLPYNISKGSTLFDLFKSLTSSKNDILKVFHNLIDVYPIEVVESSLFTFLNRVSSLETEGLNPRYSLLIKNTRSKVDKNLKPAVLKYSQSSQSPLDLLSMLLELVS